MFLSDYKNLKKNFFLTTVVQLMTDQSRYFNPSKTYWFSFNAFLGPGWFNELGRWI